jgi:hypothetical protein
MAVHMLVGLLEAGPDRVPHRDLRVVESELVVRESCRPRS